MASGQKSAVKEVQQEIAKIEVKQSMNHHEESFRMEGISKGTHTNKSQKKPWKMNIRK